MLYLHFCVDYLKINYVCGQNLRHSKCGNTAIMLLLQTDMTDPTQLASRLAQQRSEKPYAYLQLASSNSK